MKTHHPAEKERIKNILEIVFGIALLIILFSFFSGHKAFAFFLSIFFVILLMLEYIWYQMRSKINISGKSEEKKSHLKWAHAAKKPSKEAKQLPMKKESESLPPNVRKAFYYYLTFLASFLIVIVGYTFREWITSLLGLILMLLSIVGYRIVRKSPVSSKIIEKEKEIKSEASAAKKAQLEKELGEMISAEKKAEEAAEEERKRYKALQKKIKEEERKRRKELWKKRWAERAKERKARKERMRLENAKKRLEEFQKAREKLIQKEKALSEFNKTREELGELRDMKLHIKSTSKYETDLDRLLEMVEKYNVVALSEAAAIFKVDVQKIEEWARILESHNLLRVHYPAFGEPELRKVNQ